MSTSLSASHCRIRMCRAGSYSGTCQAYASRFGASDGPAISRPIFVTVRRAR